MHRRLAIRDFSPTGLQPIWSPSGTHNVAYNGEACATEARERRLVGRCLGGTSNTDLLVEACAEWEMDRVLLQLNEQPAFALWDVAAREMTLTGTESA